MLIVGNKFTAMNEKSSIQSNPVKDQPLGFEGINPASRRRFLLGTGKVGALAILGLHNLKVEVVAGTGSGDPNM